MKYKRLQNAYSLEKFDDNQEFIENKNIQNCIGNLYNLGKKNFANYKNSDEITERLCKKLNYIL
jgi:hypothetical protein